MQVTIDCGTSPMLSARLSPTLVRQLQVFCECARHLSFKTAADALFLTPSAISHQVKDLESSLGVRLFERRTRAIRLTSHGEALQSEVQPLLLELAAAVGRVSAHRSRRSVSVVVPPFFASELFVPRLSSFYALQPHIDIRLDTSDPRPSTHASIVDVSVVLTDTQPSDVQHYELFTLDLVPACSRGLSQVVTGEGSQALSDHTLILHRTRPDAWQRWSQAAQIELPEPKSVIELDSMYAVVRAAERGLGIALVPSVLASAWFRTQRLVRLSAVEVSTNETYYLVHRHDDSRRPEIRALASWALTEFRK
jgi:LysR family transcriptional regulator, glycine cleavage system transcriptional activator